MSTDKKDIFVFAHWMGMPEPVLIGVLSAHQGKGRKSFSFEYDNKWLKNKRLNLLDPDISFYSGPQFPNNKENFGIFLDSMPDTWGRTLMKRKAALQAVEDGVKLPILRDVDYLLGVADNCRMGAIRFKTSLEGPFSNDDSNLTIPPWVSVAELQHIAHLVESDNVSKDFNKWLAVLMAPGSSLGGARPKASILDSTGHPWIAKFPSKNDSIDKAKWEFLAFRLAKLAGIKMADSKIEQVAGNYNTFFTKRFDRCCGERIHFASAMTMTGKTEEIIRDNPASYLDIALFIHNNSGNPNEDLHELWKRMVFNIAISNTDDHLRNHGFLIYENNWRLSPAFDLNPSTDKEQLSLNIDEKSGQLDFDLAMSVKEYFRLNDKDASSILFEVKMAVANWEKIAKQIGIKKSEIMIMNPAFRY